MIRKLREEDANRVIAIWLDTNVKTHYFISAAYWKNNLDFVKEALSQAEVYVYEKNQNIQGFIGLNGEFIEGIFVSDTMQSQGIGGLLLNFIKMKRDRLCLRVYQKNERAIRLSKRRL